MKEIEDCFLKVKKDYLKFLNKYSYSSGIPAPISILPGWRKDIKFAPSWSSYILSGSIYKPVMDKLSGELLMEIQKFICCFEISQFLVRLHSTAATFI